MKDLLVTALLRLAIYFAPILFGVLGALVVKLGLGSYDAVAGTITISLSAFITAITVMVTAGVTAATALLAGWRSRKAGS